MNSSNIISASQKSPTFSWLFTTLGILSLMGCHTGGSASRDGGSADAGESADGDAAWRADLAQPMDLALRTDLARRPDLALPADLATPVDLQSPADMTVVRSVTGTLSINYPGVTRAYTDWYYCDAYYYAPPSVSLIRMQQNNGYTVWMVTVGGSTSAGAVPVQPSNPSNGLSITVSEADSTLPGMLQGSWQYSTGTANLTTVDLRNGGHVVGTASGTLTHIMNHTTATFSVTFDAVLR